GEDGGGGRRLAPGGGRNPGTAAGPPVSRGRPGGQRRTARSTIRGVSLFDRSAPEGAGWSPAAQADRRKVRAPSGRVLANGQGGRPHGQRHRKQTAARPRARGKGETVR